MAIMPVGNTTPAWPAPELGQVVRKSEHVDAAEAGREARRQEEQKAAQAAEKRRAEEKRFQTERAGLGVKEPATPEFAPLGGKLDVTA